jgi:hypothetical protein
MASLKTLLGATVEKSQPLVFYVFNTNVGEAVNDGGRCCAVVIPAGYKSAIVELWGGGGTGGGSCCCQWPYSQASAGSHVQTKFSVESGETYTVCAAGSTGCTQFCGGISGTPSFIVRAGGSTCACAHGGISGCNLCFFKGFSCTGICVPSCVNASANIGCVSVCTARGYSQTSNFCASDMYESIPGSSKFSQNSRMGFNQCTSSAARVGCCRNRNHWPSGPGNGGGACGGGFCWSGWGAGGLVIMTLT